jgi:hypothetical protein
MLSSRPASQRTSRTASALRRARRGRTSGGLLGALVLAVGIASVVGPEPADTTGVVDAQSGTVGDAPGGLRLFDPKPVRPRGLAAMRLAEVPATVPAGVDVHALASRPGAERTIYLDFTGGVVPAGSIWSYSETIPYPAYTADGDHSAAFSPAEQVAIYRAWQTVVEDFAPFDVNVTTVNPGVEALRRTNETDPQFGVHAIITQAGIPAHERTCKSTCGGVAVLDSLDLTTVAPVWTFSPPWRPGEGIGTTTSHEIGHALGLWHDGHTDGYEYHSGSVSWGPIMGGSMDSAAVSHWSNGDYLGATNHEDDLSVMSTWLPLLPDDHAASAPPVVFTGSASGVINDRGDSDAFTFTADGKVTVRVSPNETAPNLDATLALYSTDGQLLTRVDDVRSDFTSAVAPVHLSATWRVILDRPTTLVAVVDGTGSDQPGYSYSDYASIGHYTVSVTAGPGAPKWEKARWVAKVRARRWWSGVLRVTRSQGDLTIKRVGSKRGGLRIKVSEDGRGVRVFGRPHKVGMNKVRLVAVDQWGERTTYVAKVRVLPQDAPKPGRN